MNTAKQVNNHRAGSRILGRAVLGERPVSHKDAEARAGVGLQHIHNGLAHLSRLLGADWGEDAVINGIVQEQYLGRLNKHGDQRQDAVVDQESNACAQHRQNAAHERANRVIAQNRKDHAKDTDREIVDQHLEAGRHMAVHRLVELLDNQSCKRAHNHSAQQHRLTIGAADAGNAAHDRNRAHHAAAVAAD